VSGPATPVAGTTTGFSGSMWKRNPFSASWAVSAMSTGQLIWFRKVM
jgi:hypothetical protein